MTCCITDMLVRLTLMPLPAMLLSCHQTSRKEDYEVDSVLIIDSSDYEALAARPVT